MIGAFIPQLQEETYPVGRILPRGKIPPVMADTFLQSELRRRMKLCGLSARALSLKAGLNETFVKAVLRGNSRNPRTDTLGAIADVLGCKTDDLLGPGPERRDKGLINKLPLRERTGTIEALKGLLREAGINPEDDPPPRRASKRGRKSSDFVIKTRRSRITKI
jgi:transcriptional regulator with XRE-family HTH domain